MEPEPQGRCVDVEDLPKDFNPEEKRPSQSSEDNSWAFLEDPKSADGNSKTPKITINR